MNALYVFLGGGTGSVLRYLVGLWIGSAAFPWATFAVNAVGSLEFLVCEVADGKVVSSEIVSSGGVGHGALAGLLGENKIDLLICGGIGGGATLARVAFRREGRALARPDANEGCEANVILRNAGGYTLRRTAGDVVAETGCLETGAVQKRRFLERMKRMMPMTPVAKAEIASSVKNTRGSPSPETIGSLTFMP